MSQPVPDTPTSPTGRRRRWLIALLLLAGVGGALFYVHSRLNPLERQMVGRWGYVETYDDGSTCERMWEMRSDRTCCVHNTFRWTANARRAASVEEQSSEATWYIRDGRLIVDPERPLLDRMDSWQFQTFRRVRNTLTGTKVRTDDSWISNGRLSEMTHDSVIVIWWDPDKQIEYSSNRWMRTETPAEAE